MKDENKGKISKLKIGSLLFIVFLVIYIPSLLYWIYGRSITTDIIQPGSIENTISTDGIIVRDEKVIKSPFQGTCIFEAEEGDKIPAKSAFATVLNESSDNLLERLKEIDTKIINIQKAKLNLQKVFSDDIKKIDDQIGVILSSIIDEGNHNNIGNMTHLKDEVDKLIMKKANILGNSGAADTYTASLRTERDSLENQINRNTRKIDTEDSGIISYVIDGNEDTLNPAGVNEYTPQFLGKIDTQKTINSANISEVESGQPLARIVKSIYYYILITLNSKEISDFKEGDRKDIRINDIGKTITGTIDHISKNSGGKCVISFKTDEALNETLEMRKISCDILMDNFEGLKVPLESLVNIKGNSAEIILVKAKCADFRKVEILGRDKDFAVLKYETDGTVGLYDTYVVKPGNITDGQFIS